MGHDILIVDDEQTVRDMLSLVLRPLNTPIRQASGGVEALNLIAAELPRLIILDLMMPDMDGGTILRSLKADPRTAHIPVLIYTAKPLSPELRHELETNSSAIMRKGDSIRDIRNIVTQCLPLGDS